MKSFKAGTLVPLFFGLIFLLILYFLRKDEQLKGFLYQSTLIVMFITVILASLLMFIKKKYGLAGWDTNDDWLKLVENNIMGKRVYFIGQLLISLMHVVLGYLIAIMIFVNFVLQ